MGIYTEMDRDGIRSDGMRRMQDRGRTDHAPTTNPLDHIILTRVL
jgi:hypothetical protein